MTLVTTIHEANPDDSWWRDAVIYQIYPRSFADSNGDGLGDLVGTAAHLDYIKTLGVDGIWLSPYYPSPQADAGYDVADYRAVDPRFGTLDDAAALIAGCHDRGLVFITDLVPNHTSDEHPWFVAARTAAPGSPERARYHFRDGRGPDAALPPNNWKSVFGGPAWTRLPDGQWYLHLFDSKQPDLNWDHPEVRADFERTLRFWCDLGVDGFRVDVAHALLKEPGLPDWDEPQELLGGLTDIDPHGPKPPMWDQPGVHEIYRSWRRILDSYGTPAKMMVAEAWVSPLDAWAAYVRPDEMHQSFDFAFLECSWDATDLRAAIEGSLAAADSVGAPTTWVLSNHDVVRHVSRLGLPVGTPRPHGIGPGDPQPDEVLGLRRGRAATTLMLGLPGSAYLYQGEELGLLEVCDLPDEVRQDPAWFRSNHAEVGRDGCRVPIPWVHDAPHYGFGPGRPWLPQPESFARYAVDVQDGVEGSTLELYRTLLRLRRELRLGRGSLTPVTGFGPEVIAYAVHAPGHPRVVIVLNLGEDAVTLPPGADILVASGDLDGGQVPQDTAVWATW